MSRSSVSRHVPPTNPMVESLENRRLFAAPRATSIITDNRGEVQITFDTALNASTVTSANVQVHTAGADDTFGTADDVKRAVGTEGKQWAARYADAAVVRNRLWFAEWLGKMEA